MSQPSTQLAHVLDRARARSNREIIELWKNARTSDDACPSYTHFNVNSFSSHAETVLVLQPMADGDFHYCHFTSPNGEQMKRDLTGTRHSELRHAIADELAICFRNVLETGLPMLVVHGNMRVPAVHTWEHLIMPVESAQGRMLITNLVPIIHKVDLINSIMQASPGAILACSVVDQDIKSVKSLVIMMANQAAERLFDQPEDRLVGRRVLELIGLEAQPAFEAVCNEVFATGMPNSLKLNSDAQAGQLPLVLTISPFDGGLVLTFAELGALKRAYEDLALREQELADVRAELDRQSAKLTALADEVAQARARNDQEAGERRRLEEELRRLAETDDMTGIWNRRAFFGQLQAEIARTVRYGHPPTLLYLDIDAFKDINDTYGHAAGDAVIREVVARIGSVLRCGVDLVGRLGGDEFAILLPETDLAGAAIAAERIRLIVAETPFDIFDRLIPVTVSVGIAAWTVPAQPDQSTESIDDWVARADQALYQAKKLGRNLVQLAESMSDRYTATAAG